MRQRVFSKRVGDRMRFAVEFEAHKLADGSLPRLWNEWWGYLWLWADGHLVGDPFECEMVSLGMESLMVNASETGKRESSALSGYSADQALEAGMWSVYGDDDTAHEKLVSCRKNLELLEVLPRAGPFFDSWQAILLEEGTNERFIYRRNKEPIAEAVWALGTFRDVVVEASNEFEGLARSSLPGGAAAG